MTVVLSIFLPVEAGLLCHGADFAAGVSSSSLTVFNSCCTVLVQKLASRWSPRVDDCGSPSAGNLRPSWECTLAGADGDRSRCTLLPNGILRSSQAGQHTPPLIWTSPLSRATTWLPVRGRTSQLSGDTKIPSLRVMQLHQWNRTCSETHLNMLAYSCRRDITNAATRLRLLRRAYYSETKLDSRQSTPRPSKVKCVWEALVPWTNWNSAGTVCFDAACRHAQPMVSSQSLGHQILARRGQYPTSLATHDRARQQLGHTKIAVSEEPQLDQWRSWYNVSHLRMYTTACCRDTSNVVTRILLCRALYLNGTIMSSALHPIRVWAALGILTHRSDPNGIVRFCDAHRRARPMLSSQSLRCQCSAQREQHQASLPSMEATGHCDRDDMSADMNESQCGLARAMSSGTVSALCVIHTHKSMQGCNSPGSSGFLPDVINALRACAWSPTSVSSDVLTQILSGACWVQATEVRFDESSQDRSGGLCSDCTSTCRELGAETKRSECN
jgi:hypothetical protein